MLSIQFKGEILQNQYSSILIKIKLTTSIVYNELLCIIKNSYLDTGKDP